MILQLDYTSDEPIYLQIRNQVVHEIASGALSSGEKLPPIRTLAAQAGINVMTVSKAYQILKQEGYLVSDRRSGARIAIPNTRQDTLTKSQKERLALLISEARLQGVAKENFMTFIDEQW